MWQLYIGLLATLWWKTALSASEPTSACTGICNKTISVADSKVSSLCYPSNYQDNTICSLSLLPAGTTFTQLTFNSFDVESWHDYLEFKGPENFILFANEISNRVIMTGYPNTTITSLFHTDSHASFKGYEYTASSVNATTLLNQYKSYNTTSSAQIMASPMYVTSADATLTDMDIMAIYLGNNTNKSLADAWPEYVKLVIMTDSPIRISNESATGFTINWTAVASTKRHAVSIEDSSKTLLSTKKDTSSTSFHAQNLPSGSRFTVTVYFINKHGTEAPVTQSASTLIKDPKGFKATSISQTAVSLSWNMINGAKNYTIQLNGTTTKKVEVGTNTAFESLTPGESYTASITAQYEIGASKTVTTSFQTDPGNVTGIRVYDERRNSMRISWNAVKGATEYLVTYRESGTNDPKTVTAGSNTTLIISSLTPGTLFKLSVVAKGASGGKSYPEEHDGITRLLTGKETVTQIRRTRTSITVSWTNVAAAKAYFVSIVSDGQTTPPEKVEPPKTNHSMTGLATGTNYMVTVYAQGNSGRNDTVGSINATTDTASVTNAKAIEPVSNSSITLTWDKVTGATEYSIAIRDETAGTTTGRFDDVRNVSYPPYPANKLLPGKLYRFNITAKFEVGSGPAISISAWTLPPPVTNLTTSNIASDGFKASWSHIPNATYILTLRFRSGEHIWDNKNALPGQFFDTKRDPGRKYVLAVTSENPDLRRSKEVTTTFETPLAHPNVWTDGVTRKSFALKWKSVDGASRYYSQCSNTYQTVNFTGDSNNLVQIVQSNLSFNTKYFCNLTAVSIDGMESSASLNVTTGISVCTDKTCLNGGKCSDAGKEEFKCDCTLTSYEGKQCENVINWCGGKDQYHRNCGKNTECINDPIERKGVCKCKGGYKGDPKVGCIAYCESTVIVTDNNVELNFNSTYIGTTVYSIESCTDSSGKKRAQGSVLCKASTSSGAAFGKEVYSPCSANVSSVVPNTTLSADVTSEELKQQTAQLQLVTSGETNKVPLTEVKKVSEFMANVGNQTKKGTVGVEVLSNVANTASNLIESRSLSSSTTSSPTAAPSVTTTSGTSTTTRSAVDESIEIKKRILASLNTMASNVKLPNNSQPINITTPNIVIQVRQAPPNLSPNDDLRFQPVIPAPDDNGSKNVNSSKTVQPVRIVVPVTVLSKVRKGGNSSVRVSFLLHTTPILFPDRTRNPGPSPIVAANIGDDEHIKIPKGSYVKMRFANQERSGVKSNGSKFIRTVTAYECAYWNVSLNAWRTDGCYWDLSNLSNPSGCACDHLTNFAILVSKEPLGPDIPLEIVSIVGLSLSMLGLVLTIIIHAVKEEVRKRRPTLILFHICTNLLISSAIFVAGVDRNEKKMQCIVIATFMQYFYLTSWTWMTVYAYDMYRSLVQVFGVGKSRYMTKCTIFGYGVPLLITIIDVGVTVGYIDPRVRPKGALPRKDNNYVAWDNRVYRESAYVAENMCWIHKYSLSMGFLVPVAIMLVFNVFVYAMVIKTLYQRGQSVQSSAKKTGIKDKIFISITLIASTGIAWVFGYFMLLSTDKTYLNIMSWIFALLNSIQGLVIFLSTCVRNENMRKIWLEPLRNCCSSAGSKASLLSPKSNKHEINTKSSANESLSFSSSTKNTNVQSLSSKPLTSESAI